MSIFYNKKILIIGGTGTIGKGLIKELVKYTPEVVRIFSRDEYKQFEMQHDSITKDLNKVRFLIGDVRDYDRVERAMNGIDIVFNLAAMKHVGSCEYNPDEAIKTNVDGMQNVIKAAIKNDVECVLFTSSDKAINPTNTYGATKMLAEKLVQAAAYSKGNVKTKFVAVRFGNVIGSRGSVLPLFKSQIINEGRVTITDPNMSRFMMTTTQAVKLMIKSCEEAIGGEVFVLKMPVMRLEDFTDVVIEETCEKYGLSFNEIKKEVIGIRPGERLFEELMTFEESHYARDLGEMYVVLPTTYNVQYYKSAYERYDECEKVSYSSEKQEKISKDCIRKMLKEDGLF